MPMPDASWLPAAGCELLVAGQYEVHFTLNGKHLNSSPLRFRVKPSGPSGKLSTLHPPVDTPPVTNVLYELTLIAEDKYANKLDRGGANDARVASKVTSNPKTTHGRWNDSPRGHAVFVPSTVPSARVFGNGDDPYGDLEDAPDLDDDGFAEDSVFGGEKVWATGPSGAEPRAKGGADFRGWGDAAAVRRLRGALR